MFDVIWPMVCAGCGAPSRGVLCTARDWARALAKRTAGLRVEALVPVPTPWTRLLWRGFSFPHLLAEALSRRVGVPVRPVLSMRRGARQATLDARERSQNLRGRVRCRVAISGAVVLVDDVMTTGATATACATELLGSGAHAVHLLTGCVADRTPDGISVSGSSLSA